MAVNPRTRIPAAVRLLRILNADGDDTRAVAEFQRRCEIAIETKIAKQIVPEKMVLSQTSRTAIDAIESIKHFA